MDRSPSRQGPWTSLWIVALVSLLAQLAICQFFTFGTRVPLSIDVNPCNLWKYAYQFPPRGEFLVLNWLGVANLPPSLNPFSFAALLPPWLFFTAYAPIIGTLALLAMAAFLRELEVPRPAALFGAIVYAWQGDILPFVFPGHYAYIATWPFYAIAAWGALHSQRTRHWAGALASGVGCGMMVALQPDRGAIASLLIGALYLASAWRGGEARWAHARHLVLCAAVALVVSLASFLALFQSFIVGVSLGGTTSREETYRVATQFSYGPEETLTYLVPGFFGWTTSSPDGPYWGRIGEGADWPKKHTGTRNLNLAISTTGTVAATLALLAAAVLLLPGGWLGTAMWSARQAFFGRVLLALGAVALVLAWGDHTPLYRLLFELPLMDKWRNPLKWLEMTNFALVTLSAFGVQHLFGSLEDMAADQPRVANRRAIRVLDGTAVVLVLGLLASYPFTIQLAPQLLDAQYEPAAVASIMATLHTSLLFAAGIMVAACVLVRVLWRPEFLRRWKLENPWLHRGWHALLEQRRLPLTLALGLAALSVAQLAWVTGQFVVSSNLALLTRTNPLVEQLKNEGNTVRVSVDSGDPVLNVLLQNQFATPLISCLEISAASRVPDRLTAFSEDLKSDIARLWLLAGVKNRAIPQSDFNALRLDPQLAANIDHADGYNLAPVDTPDLPSHALVQFKNYFEKATFVPRAEIMPSDDAQLKRIRDPKWNPRETVLLEALAGQDSPASMARPMVDVETYTYHRIDLAVTAPGPGYILINDAYDPDWRVEVNGRAEPLLRADYILRAVAVPAGRSSVALRYDAHYRGGGWLNVPTVLANNACDGVMVAAWLVAGVTLWRRRGRDDGLAK